MVKEPVGSKEIQSFMSFDSTATSIATAFSGFPWIRYTVRVMREPGTRRVSFIEGGDMPKPACTGKATRDKRQETRRTKKRRETCLHRGFGRQASDKRQGLIPCPMFLVPCLWLFVPCLLSLVATLSIVLI